jgi:eukaryotic-like serine/threonine-protein kinase
VGPDDRQAATDQGLDSSDELLRAVARAPEVHPAHAGTVINDTFRIERRLGAGGMGVVYLARDVILDRDVALKLHSSPAGPARERMLREARLMARLSHPNVVTVYEVGLFEGRLFIAMEFLDGGTLRAWLAERPRSWREIVTRYLAAARGLLAAHEAGLVHRDFKPDNVLLGRDGRLRVADFGVAMALGADDEGQALAAVSSSPRLTATGAEVGTPAYMSPEQRQAGVVDARSDQYSFCVSLSEALAHARREPPHWLRRAIARGLTVDPGARHPSMAALIKRLEAGLHRRRTALALLAVALLAAGASVGGWAVAHRPAACAGERAALGDTWGPTRARDVRAALGGQGDLAAAALDTYANDWVAARHDVCVAARVRRVEPEYVLWQRISCLDRARAQFDATVNLLSVKDPEVARHAARAIAELPRVAFCRDSGEAWTVASPPSDLTSAVEVDTLRADFGRVEAQFFVGHPGACAAATALVPRADAIGWQPLRAEVLELRAECEIDRDDLRAAELSFQAAFEAGLGGGNFGPVARGMAYLAHNLADSGRLDEAGRWIGLAHALAAQLGEDDLRAMVDVHIAWVALRAGRIDEASAAAARTVEAYRRLFGEDYDYASALITRGAIELEQGRYAAAAETEQQAADILDRVAPGGELAATALGNLANARLLLGDLPAAEAAARRALDQQTARFGPGTHALVPMLWVLSQVQSGRGDLSGALATLEQVRAIDEKAPDLSPWELGELLGNEAILEVGLDHLDRALELAGRSRDLLRATLGPDHPRVVQATTILGTLLRQAGRLDESARALGEAHALAERVLPADNPVRVNAAVELALTDLALGRAAAAVALLEPAIDPLARIGVPENLAEARFALARALWDSGGDRARALAAAVAARDAYVGLGDLFAGPHAAVDAWLRAHQR